MGKQADGAVFHGEVLLMRPLRQSRQRPVVSYNVGIGNS
jgi:hypothetical protein